MSKERRGTKRLCKECGNKFYDLGREPVICPVCETPHVLEKPKPRTKEEAEEPKAAAVEEKATEVTTKKKSSEPEFVSLDEAEAEEASEDDVDLADLGDDDEDIPEDDEEDVFLEDDEDDDGSDVSGIIGGPVDPKEEG